MGVADRLKELGLQLPERRSAGSYVGAVRTGDLVFTAGAGPQRADGTFVTGKVGVGKTTVADTLALDDKQLGKNVLFREVDSKGKHPD